jgi:hypothetical protein
MVYYTTLLNHATKFFYCHTQSLGFFVVIDAIPSLTLNRVTSIHHLLILGQYLLSLSFRIIGTAVMIIAHPEIPSKNKTQQPDIKTEPITLTIISAASRFSTAFTKSLDAKYL